MLLAIEPEGLCQTELVQNPRPSPPPERLHSTASRLDTGDPTTGLLVDGIISADLLINQFRSTMSDLLQEKLAAISRELDTIKISCYDLDKRVEPLEHKNRSLRARETVITLEGTVESQESANNSAMTSVETIQPEVISTLSKTVDAIRVHFQEEIDKNKKRIEALERNPASTSAISFGDRHHLESGQGVSQLSAPTLTSHYSSNFLTSHQLRQQRLPYSSMRRETSRNAPAISSSTTYFEVP